MTTSSLFDDGYLEALYGRRSNKAALPGYISKRFAAMRTASTYDLVWIEKEALPWVPWAIERLAWPRHTPVVCDYDDAIFHNYDRLDRPVVRAVLGRKIDNVMRAATTVIAGNAYLADHAVRAGAGRVAIVPTVVDIDRYSVPAPSPEPTGKIAVGWIGSPTTAPYLAALAPAFFADPSIDWVAVGARQDQLAGTPFRAEPWTEDSEVALIAGFDIGIMPLPDTDWAKGKCGYKLIQYMACGRPVIASPIGANAEIVSDGQNGLLASTPEEWRTAIAKLTGDADLRAQMGAAGRQRVERTYSVQAQIDNIADILLDATVAR